MLHSEIKYKGLSLPGECPQGKNLEELLLDAIILQSDIPVSEEKVEQELQMELAGFLQTMRYRAMGGDHQMEEIDLDEWKKNIRDEIIRDRKVDFILRTVIEKEQISATMEELEQAALKLAQKEQTTLEMVRRFMGDDYALLKKDVLYEKARNFIVAAAQPAEESHS